jgi:hypothetical protein
VRHPEIFLAILSSASLDNAWQANIYVRTFTWYGAPNGEKASLIRNGAIDFMPILDRLRGQKMPDL